MRDTARSISLVNKDRIQNATQQLGLDEALAIVPGLYMQNRYNFAQDLRVALRGYGVRYFEPAPLRNLYAGVVVRFD